MPPDDNNIAPGCLPGSHPNSVWTEAQKPASTWTQACTCDDEGGGGVPGTYAFDDSTNFDDNTGWDA